MRNGEGWGFAGGGSGGCSNLISPKRRINPPAPPATGKTGNLVFDRTRTPSSHPQTGQRKGESGSKGISVLLSAFSHEL